MRLSRCAYHLAGVDTVLCAGALEWARLPFGRRRCSAEPAEPSGGRGRVLSTGALERARQPFGRCGDSVERVRCSGCAGHSSRT